MKKITFKVWAIIDLVWDEEDLFDNLMEGALFVYRTRKGAEIKKTELGGKETRTGIAKIEIKIL